MEVADRLGCSRKEHPTEQLSSSLREAKRIVPCASTLSVLCPALSLKHEPSSHSNGSSKRGRAQAEEHASSLLERPLQIALCGETGSLEDEDIPERLLQNVYESFAKLVHSRLRALSTLIARHGLKEKKNAEQVESKLQGLFQVAGAVYAEEMITRFECHEEVDLEDDSSEGVVLTFRVSLDLVLPTLDGEDQIVKIGLACPGEIQGREHFYFLLDLSAR